MLDFPQAIVHRTNPSSTFAINKDGHHSRQLFGAAFVKILPEIFEEAAAVGGPGVEAVVVAGAVERGAGADADDRRGPAEHGGLEEAPAVHCH